MSNARNSFMIPSNHWSLKKLPSRKLSSKAILAQPGTTGCSKLGISRTFWWSWDSRTDSKSQASVRTLSVRSLLIEEKGSSCQWPTWNCTTWREGTKGRWPSMISTSLEWATMSCWWRTTSSSTSSSRERIVISILRMWKINSWSVRIMTKENSIESSFIKWS